MDLKKQYKKLDRSSRLLAFVYSIFIVVPIYWVVGNAYYLDYLNGFVFLGALIAVMFSALIFLIIFRKDKFKSLIAILVVLLLFLIWGYEIRLLNYESHTYIADGFREPEELLEDQVYISLQ